MQSSDNSKSDIDLSSRSICLAAREGDEKTLKYLIKTGRSVNSTNPHGWTPLHLAVFFNKEECVDYLLKRKDLRIDAETHAGETALLLACQNYYHVRSSMVQKLITAGADVNIVQNEYKSPLYSVCQRPNNIQPESYSDNLKKAELLINAGAQLNIPETYEGDTPLFAAVEQRNVQLVNMLLHAEADANFQRYFDECSPLILAAQTDDYEVVSTLMPFVADVNCKTVDGRTPLMLAQNVHVLRLLLDQGADPDVIARDKQVLAVHLAAFRRNLDKLSLLLPLTSPAVISKCVKHNLITFICNAVESESDLPVVFDCLKYILSSDIDNSMYFLSYPQSHFYPSIAALFLPEVLKATDELWQEYLSILYLFLSKGINVNPQDNQQHLLLAFTLAYRKWSPRLEEILDVLTEHGLNADQFARLFVIKDNILFTPGQFDAEFVTHLIAYFFSHASSIYKSLTDSFTPGGEVAAMFDTFNLKSFCRSRIRKGIKEKCTTTAEYLQYVNSLPIPRTLKHYIRFKFY